MAPQVKISLAVMVFVALLVPRVGQAADAPPPSLSAGKSFLDHASTNYAEEPSDLVPANFPGPLVAQPRHKPEQSAMLLACLGLFVYLGRRRSKALAAAAT
jgi:hypothetical protein